MNADAERLQMVRHQVRDRLLQLCRAEQARATDLHPRYGQLWQAIINQVAGGGKFLRPYIVMLTYEAYDGSGMETGTDVAAAWELLHIGLLMHDDVIDRDYNRRGQLNIAGQYLEFYGAGREHYAQSAALLAGDLALATARRLLQDPQLIAIFDEAYVTVIGGELLDMEAGILNEPVDLQLIAEAKTASYSLIGPLLTGATLAGAAESELTQLRELGRILGVGFQLADDLLVFGSDDRIGKSADSDLAEGKRTMVIETALKLMGNTERAQAESMLANPSPQNVPLLRELIESTDVLNLLSMKLTDTAKKSTELIQGLDISQESKVNFENLVKQVLVRSA